MLFTFINPDTEKNSNLLPCDLDSHDLNSEVTLRCVLKKIPVSTTALGIFYFFTLKAGYTKEPISEAYPRSDVEVECSIMPDPYLLYM